MASEPTRRTAPALLALAALAGFAPVPAAAADAPRAFIYQCDMGNGRKLTSDRLIPECANKEQRQLRPDGSLFAIIPPTPTDDERAENDRKQRESERERGARNDAVRRDRNLLQRFPDEAVHRADREKALGDVRQSIRLSNERIKLMNTERKPLLDELEFYVGKPVPSKLKNSLDANEASLEAQKSLQQTQQAELIRITALYDAELLRLKKLWAGAPAGSLGPPPSVGVAPVALPAAGTVQSTSAPVRPLDSAQPGAK